MSKNEDSNTLLVGVQQQQSEYEQRQEFLSEAKEEYKPIEDPEYNRLLNALSLVMQEEEDELQKERRKLRRKGLVRTYAYHCNRCNYVWLPKDFDEKSTDCLSFGIEIEDILRPNSCARCKSKYWNDSPSRKTKHNADPKNPERWTKSRMIPVRRKYRRLIERLERAEKEFHKQMGQMETE